MKLIKKATQKCLHFCSFLKVTSCFFTLSTSNSAPPLARQEINFKLILRNIEYLKTPPLARQEINFKLILRNIEYLKRTIHMQTVS